MKNYSLLIRTIRLFYKNHKRDLPWRNKPSHYEVFVSEVMLQQTQVSRVLLKFPAFIKQFPSFKALAKAPLAKVLLQWQGMGYNRRALYLQKSAKLVMTKYRGRLPQDPLVLKTFPGIGVATAASIVVFSWNKPLVFIETNIRRVFIHHFFQDAQNINDKDIYPLVEKTLDRKNPREWYYALMDYGSYLAKQTTNPNRKSKHYAKQSQFEGSDRQIRGFILRSLLEKHSLAQLEIDNKRLMTVVNKLLKEGLIRKTRIGYSIS